MNFEGVHKTLPIGARSNPIATHGVSWWVDVLPFLEQASAYEQLDREGSQAGFLLMHPDNGRVVGGLLIPSMACPSTPFPTSLPVGGFQVMMPSYVGIAGATSHDGFREKRVNVCCVPASDGEISAGGTLVPNKSIQFRQVVDGLSKTIAVGEASDYSFDTRGVPFRIDAGFPSGWILGTTVPGTPPNYAATFPSWNITTIRYRPNERRYNLAGINQNRGADNPLVSPHPGGVHLLRLDGSVQFTNQEMAVGVLKKLATRDDGETLEEPH